MGPFFSKSTNAREGRGKGYHGREERLRSTREGQKQERDSRKTRKAKQQRTNTGMQTEEKRLETSSHERQP